MYCRGTHLYDASRSFDVFVHFNYYYCESEKVDLFCKIKKIIQIYTYIYRYLNRVLQNVDTHVYNMRRESGLIIFNLYKVVVINIILIDLADV